jgi:nicotinate (nicotinamide) nucleotide adenylyltransferase
MLELATRDVEHCAIWTDEIDRGGLSSYTIDTLRRARRVLGDSTRLRLLIGADQASAFHRWREYRAIMELAEPVVMLREPAESVEAVVGSLRASGAWTDGQIEAWRDRIAPGGRFDASSTRIRQLLHESEDPLHDAELSRLMDKRVLGYIVEHGLYR